MKNAVVAVIFALSALVAPMVVRADKIVVEYDDDDHDEGDEIQLKVHLENSDGATIKNTQGDMWVFIKGQEESDQDAICAKEGVAKAGTMGIKFPNYASLAEQFWVEVLDGDESKGGLNFTYDVVFLDCAKWPDTPENVTAHTVSYYKNNTPVVFTVRNVIPSVDFIWINDGAYEVYESGTALSAKLPAGVTNTLSAIVTEPGELDRTAEEDDLFTVRWRFTDAAGGVDTVLVKGDPDAEESVCRYDFPKPGTYKVQVDLKDKDMGNKYGNGEYDKTFDFTVDVFGNPEITVTGISGDGTERTVFDENESLDAGGDACVAVNLGFNNFTKDLEVKLEVAPGGAENPGVFVLQTNQFVKADAADPNVYYVTFGSGMTERLVNIKMLDGTQVSRTQGFTLTPTMVSTDLDPKSDKPANKYYNGVPKVLKINNVAPAVESSDLYPQPGTNVFEVALGAADPITWHFTDVLPDFTDNGTDGITVTVKGGGGFTTNVIRAADAAGSFTPVFTVSGVQMVQLTISDKDGGTANFIWNYRVGWWQSGEDSVRPTVEGDEGATVTGDAETGFVIRPSEGKTAVEVTIPQGVDAAKVTVEVSPKVTSVKPHGATVKIVNGGADITEFLDMPTADGNGVIDLTKATVKEKYVKEVLDVEKGAEIKLSAADPTLITPNTRVGLFYQLREGTTLEGMSNGDSTIGDGNPWKPEIKVKGGNAAFYSIGVGKGE